jgi:hypothetical protein
MLKRLNEKAPRGNVGLRDLGGRAGCSSTRQITTFGGACQIAGGVG